MQTIEEMKAEQEKIRKELQPIEKEISRLRSKESRLRLRSTNLDALIAEVYVANLEDPESEILKHLTHDHKENMETYKTAKAFFESMGFGMSGYFPKTGQKHISFSVCPQCSDDDLKKLKDNICKLLPYMIPFESEVEDITDDTAYLGIIDNDLSESGVLYARINVKTGEIYLCKNSYGHHRVLSKFSDIWDFLIMLRKHYYYDLGYGYDWSKD